jgi:hypothetical protein
MRLGVITTHHPVSTDQGEAWLPGAYRGGAEMSDAEYLAAAPEGVEWCYTTPEDAAAFDLILITSIDHLQPAECEYLAALEPVVFLHHDVAGLPHRRTLLEAARCVMLHTPAHEKRTTAWCEPQHVELVLSAIEVPELPTLEVREWVALAACRNHPLKGIKNARVWAARNRMPLEVMTNAPRGEVLDRMREVETFVHLPLAFESEGRAVMEAVLSGCQVVTNDLVGITSVPEWDVADVLRARIAAAPGAYWGAVCNP